MTAPWVEDLKARHVANTPRTHDAEGRPVREPLQCTADLQGWPCDVRRLLNFIEVVEGGYSNPAEDF